MSKKYKGKVCVYCSKAMSTTGDHVIGREFFLPSRRDNLPIVPACESCNNEKSQLEHYLMAVLGFGGRHPDALVNLDTMVRKRILKNAKLHSELAAAFAQSRGTTIPIDHARLEKLFAMIARGLLSYHWGVVLGPNHSAIASIFSVSGESLFNQIFKAWNTPSRVNVDLGRGTFCYEGAQATDSRQTTIWRFSMYGGIMFGGDPKVPEPGSLAVAVTGPADLILRLQSGILASD